MALEGAARTAKLDQERAEVDATINGLIQDVRDVMPGYDANEVLIALVESFDWAHTETVALVAAGCLLRLAQQ